MIWECFYFDCTKGKASLRAEREEGRTEKFNFINHKKANFKLALFFLFSKKKRKREFGRSKKPALTRVGTRDRADCYADDDDGDRPISYRSYGRVWCNNKRRRIKIDCFEREIERERFDEVRSELRTEPVSDVEIPLTGESCKELRGRARSANQITLILHIPILTTWSRLRGITHHSSSPLITRPHGTRDAFRCVPRGACVHS